MEAARETPSETAREAAREPAKETDRDAAREAARETAREAAREDARETAREAAREAAMGPRKFRSDYKYKKCKTVTIWNSGFIKYQDPLLLLYKTLILS